jgi:glycosyltransferase involved in cell wall biosynthesis
MDARPAITVVIPTTCRTVRADMLRRAICSAEDQSGVDVHVTVVVNGPHYDSDLLAELQSREHLQVEIRPTPGLPAAIRHGRSTVRTPYFSFLDDDDMLLPDALLTRARVLIDEEVDVVATNGLAGTGPFIQQTTGVEEDPLGALLRGNWLASCGALFRTASVGLDLFDGRTHHYEWTMLAFRLARAGLRIRFLDVPTYRIFVTENSQSRADAYFRAEPRFLESLMQYEMEPRHRRALHRKYLGSLHSLAERCVRKGDISAAWQNHLRSMAGSQGLKYIVFTRHLLLPSARWAAAQLTGRGKMGVGGVVA